MLKTAVLLSVLLSTLPALGQNWSLGVGSGPFVFGDFVERRLRPVSSGEPGEAIVYTLSAATRAGAVVDLERSLGERWAVRLEGSFTRAPITVRQSGTAGGFEFNGGEMSVTTFMLPIVFRINPRGSLRFHLMGGPAYAMYDAEPTRIPQVPISQGNNEWGLAYGGGVGWWFSDRFAIEGNLADIVTNSPFESLDDENLPGIDVKTPHNVHTSIGIRWRF
jgi:hypothetical protein